MFKIIMTLKMKINCTKDVIHKKIKNIIWSNMKIFRMIVIWAIQITIDSFLITHIMLVKNF